MVCVSTGAGMKRLKPDVTEVGDSACELLEILVAAAFRTDLCELRSAGRGRAQAAFARQTAMYLAHVGLGLSLSSVGEHFGRDRTTVAHACARVEDRRDQPETDQVLAILERVVQLWHRERLSPKEDA